MKSRDEINAKIREALRKRTPEQIAAAKEKRRLTNLKKYGVDNCQKLKSVSEKSKKTKLEKYGSDYFDKDGHYHTKRKQTTLKNYGVEHHMLDPNVSKRIHDKSLDTVISKYGYRSTLCTPDAKEHYKKIMLDRYGVDNYSKTEEFRVKILTNRWNSLNVDNDDSRSIPMFGIEEYLKYGAKHLYKWTCKKCGEEFYSEWDYSIYYNTPPCRKCYKFGNSIEEVNLLNYIRELCPNIEINNNTRDIINPKELDIFIPSKNIAIEFNGLYWHNDSHCTKDHLIKKSLLCKDKGIRLIHIFEDEWLYKQDIVKSRLKSILTSCNNIYARKCVIKDVNSKDARIFINNNHLQGFVGAKYNIGLYYNDELVEIMTFGGYRASVGSKSIPNEYELIRLCTKLGTRVVGGANRLFKYFINTYKPSKIISYCDRRWSDGGVYFNMGFVLDHISEPNYWYIYADKRFHRYGFRKNVLHKRLKDFDVNLSEIENMRRNGYSRIWDCGNYVFQWNKCQ